MAYTVSQADPVDSGPFVVDLWKHNLPTASAGRFPWLYAGDRAKAWLLHTEDSSVVGSVGLMSRAILSPQGMLQAGQAIDLNVDLNHRTVGPALSLTRTVVQSAKQQAYKFVYSLPNAESEPVLKRVGYRFLGSVQPLVQADPVREAASLAVAQPTAPKSGQRRVDRRGWGPGGQVARVVLPTPGRHPREAHRWL